MLKIADRFLGKSCDQIFKYSSDSVKVPDQFTEGINRNQDSNTLNNKSVGAGNNNRFQQMR